MADTPESQLPQHDEVLSWIRARNLRAAREYLLHWEASILGEFIANFSVEDALVIFRILPRGLAADIFEWFPREKQTELLSSLRSDRVRALLDEMAADDRTALFEEMPASAVRKLVNLLSAEERAIASRLLGYPESSVGRLMTPEYISVAATWTVEKVLEHIREFGHKSESFSVVYVLGEAGKLLGQVRLRDVLISDLDQLVAQISTEGALFLRSLDDQEEAVRVFSRYGVSALPVVDDEGTMLGIVTIDDVLTIAEEEATEDIQKLGGVEALHEPYLEAPFLSLIRSRASWLVVLFLGEMLTASAMAAYEEQLQRAVVLALFVPLIISSGGNTGSQAATLVIRALSIGEISRADWFKVLKRELATGLILGAMLGVVGLIRVILWSELWGGYGPNPMALGCTVAVSLLAVVLWGTFSGSMFPIILQKLGADPATSSAPFVATVVDVVGLVVYFSVASLLLPGI